MSRYQIVALRHGESVWNKENRFTGWADVDLSEKGRAEAVTGAQDLKKWLSENSSHFDLAYCSVLKRAIRTLWIVQDELDLMWLPTVKDWRLNERHYGGLAGLNKSETAAKHGEEQVKIWRRSFSVPPPLLDINSPQHPRFESKYAGVPAQSLPGGESLEATVQRVWPFWQEQVVPQLENNKKILIVAHGNSLRALLMKLGQISATEIMELNIPTGIPFVIHLNSVDSMSSFEYLAPPERVAAATHAVSNQGKK